MKNLSGPVFLLLLSATADCIFTTLAVDNPTVLDCCGKLKINIV